MRKATECLGKLNFNNMDEEQIKDEIYNLLHEFNREMNYTGTKTPPERRAIKNWYVDTIYDLFPKRKAKK